MTDRRAVSTVVDVSLCLLLVSASVLVLALAAPPPPREEPNAARRTSTILGAGTASVEYRLPGPAPPGDEDASRTATGTLAGLLADAALLDARGADDRESGFVTRTRAAVSRALRPADWRVHVVATWRPFDGSTVEGRVAVGEPPPPAVAVDAVTMTVPVGATDARTRARRAAASGGRAALARSVARSTVAVLFGPPRAGPDGRPSPRTAAAYRRFAVAGSLEPATGSDPTTDRTADPPVDRAAVVEALAARYRSELPAGNETAGSLSVGTVRIVVRTWSP